MKFMNENNGNQTELLSKVLKGIGNRLVEVSTATRGCAGFTVYEPELPAEMVEELHNNENIK